MTYNNDDASLRVVVSGMMKKPVRRSGTSIVEEEALSCFFNDAGCKVAGVRLVIDAKRGDKSRGFGFVDFEDSESVNRALKLHNKEAEGLAGKDGKLRIEKSCAVPDEGIKSQQEISDANKQPQEMEPKLALHDATARLTELIREAMQRQLNGVATQDGTAMEALPSAPFEPPACKEPSHKASPTSHQHVTVSTANNQGCVATDDDLLQRQ